ncbi:efflux RND transporter periplasmic adaptor subunit [Candidatus Pelagibacter sp.]|nr:efflux RND transporter periplasmic adaptor subunit [Candidatus Pelagibacter sp.]
MKRSTKVITIVSIFFLVITLVITARTMVGNHFKKKFSKIPPPSIIVAEVINEEFAEKLETFGTAISSKSKTFKIRKDDVSGKFQLQEKVKKGDLILNLISGNITAPFSGVLGYTGLTEDIFVSDNIFIITLDDNSTIYSDIKIPESYAPFIKRGLPVEARVSSYRNKVFKGKIDFISSRINADTRSLLSRIMISNEDLELLSGSLLEITVKFNLRKALSVPDTSIIMEGEKSYIYKVSNENITNKIEVEIGLRSDGKVEILSGVSEGDQIVAEGLKKVRPQGKIKPIKN